ncbi:MAG TPA: dynamin family protein [Polyangia bacterium]|jgi:small GTP-binding protein|nr:dynamin family protein [Polyangia bacterium]
MATSTEPMASLDEKKTAIRRVLTDLAAAAEAAGLPWVARDVRDTRLPKLEDERFSVVVLGEFNHGKSTFINALLGTPLLPTGITPTTALLAHVTHGARAAATAVTENGDRTSIDAAALADHLTVDGLAKAEAGKGDGKPDGAKGKAGARAKVDKKPTGAIHHIEITHPSPLLANRLTIVDTPGVNDINEQRADITYGYLPRADAAVFLLDATQILTASERQFLEERILRSTRDRLIFVVAKADLLDESELAETLRFARQHLAAIVPEPAIFPVSAKKALAGDRAGSGLDAFVTALGATVAHERRRLLLDNALADATRLSAFIRQSLAIHRRSLELPVPELQDRIARAQERLHSGKKVLESAAETVRAETAALKARVRQDLADFAAELRTALATDLESVDAGDIRKYLSFFVQDTWKAWTEAEGERIAAELERLAEHVIQVANENIREVAGGVAKDLGPAETKVEIKVDTLKYDASVFALGALGTTVFLFVNQLVGGVLALAAPLLAMVLRGRVATEVKAEAKEQGPLAVDRVASLIGPKLDEIIDGFGARLLEFVSQAGDALARGIADVLDQALRERKAADDKQAAAPDVKQIDTSISNLRGIEERIAEIRQRVWSTEPAAAEPGATTADA